MKRVKTPPPTPDLEKVKAAAARLDQRGMTAAALELIAMGGAPVHIRPAPVNLKLTPVDAARRGFTRGINPSAARSSFLNLPCNASR